MPRSAATPPGVEAFPLGRLVVAQLFDQATQEVNLRAEVIDFADIAFSRVFSRLFGVFRRVFSRLEVDDPPSVDLRPGQRSALQPHADRFRRHAEALGGVRNADPCLVGD